MTGFSWAEAPFQICSRSDFLQRPCPVPSVPGIYAWYFRELPHADLKQYEVRYTLEDPRFGRLSLLYVGIAPASSTSREHLQKRLATHYGGTARRSTLRLSLGALLRQRLSLKPVMLEPAKSRIDFGPDEEKLSAWMSENAFVVWTERSRPWEVEREAIARYFPLLNLDDFPENPFGPCLRDYRKAARAASKR